MWQIKPSAFAPNPKKLLCYGFGLSEAASIGPPFELFANAALVGSAKIRGIVTDEWRQSVRYHYGGKTSIRISKCTYNAYAHPIGFAGPKSDVAGPQSDVAGPKSGGG